MHYLMIILTKAENAEDAVDNVEAYLEPYADNLYDWYRIGNRWNNLLAPTEKVKQFEQKVRKQFPEIFKDNRVIYINEIEAEPTRTEIQKIWEQLGLKGKNIYYSCYGFDLSNEDSFYNSVPLKDCLEKVKEYIRDNNKRFEEAFAEIVDMKENFCKNDYSMLSYRLKMASDIISGDISTENTVFDIEECVANKIPDNIDGYYAVVVDLHN